ncbi:fumarylacetoacetate hydrolase family protein [Fredinandcohnia sp. QZ13]|uniref:fumarylacetoacetate hydrolase family protein n=1 Tax=Fredinandcohnia sp. QZ13 TaxID=3073144 RepID=UPI0028533D5A|nr:fumarylacetoacetate hydrolase family protein [Fredinandcohnia sp. QZ13]MDR4887093.1 fumarylacetoacetate hydrolase family protein [Fredinandcohnia sp. QZ13]
MRFVTAEKNGKQFIGMVIENLNQVLNLQAVEAQMNSSSIVPETMIEAISQGELFLERVSHIREWALQHPDADGILPIEDITLKAPIPKPSKNIFCVGKNYADHVIEMGSAKDIPEHVMLFTKAPTTVVGTDELVMNHKNITEQLDYEGELAVVIGKEGRGIKESEALEYVFGYTIVNDITARDIQSRHKQFFLGKSLDTSCPMGPMLVHKSLIPNPSHLSVTTKVNGETRQSGNTSQFIFPIENIISVISQGMTLEPGDIIATGTPAGVGKGFNPPRFLKAGDVIEITIDGLGTLRNKIEE